MRAKLQQLTGNVQKHGTAGTQDARGLRVRRKVDLPRKAAAGLYEEPRRGTGGSSINFLHPKDAGGVLVELVQPARPLTTIGVASADSAPTSGTMTA